MLPSVTTFPITGTPQEFEDVLKLYPVALQLVKDRAKKKKTASDLLELDKWYQESLGEEVLSRSLPHLVKEELVRLMTWKLTRGKFRPSLLNFVKSNEEKAVIKATRDGIKAAQKNNLTSATTAIMALKGVGPATASAVLAAVVPQYFSFYADEVAASLPALKNHKYQLKDYKLLNVEMVDLAHRLNTSEQKNQVETEKWTPHRVELAVWTYYLLYKHKQDALTAAAIFTEKGKRSIQKEPTFRNWEEKEEEEEGNTGEGNASRKRKKSAGDKPLPKKQNV
ncbi:hypothetical protein Pmani_025809 [Petrolisthes manimaculis]|uniref:Uncharacterized protein n=1 Tax=Petrolisthes manimaculis TaxID=1843537 RepID=A0AAE1P7D7_9EUCA|nr:hypothetical protein Pmani_025809 [Petrolisthes manimaculis]